MVELKLEAEELTVSPARGLEHAAVRVAKAQGIDLPVAPEQVANHPVTKGEEAKRRRRKKASAQSVFESTPAASSADVGYASATAPAAEHSAWTLESRPSRSTADVPFGTVRAPDVGGRTAETRSVFESTPTESKADATCANSVSVPTNGAATPTVFESMPSTSVADASNGAEPAAAAPTQERSCFESEPVESKAEVGYSRNSTVSESGAEAARVVFENEPAESKAEVGYGRNPTASESGAEAARAIFESEPTKSTAAATHSDAVQAETSQQSVFESQPTESKAHARAGVDATLSESEYETDEEEEGEVEGR
mmetsp:Transcript_104217/g.290324  ORF Transcript_104217/g.290324 Transcript_104217/m.290324 type:complete len:312 (+) Transcript_104217:85-1020(+)